MIDESTKKLLINYITVFFKAKESIDNRLSLDEQTDLVNQVIRIEESSKLKNILFEGKDIKTSKKESKLLSDLKTAYDYYDASRKMYTNREAYNEIDDKSMFITYVLITFFNLFSVLIELVKYARTSIILSTIEEIDINKTAQELNELDKKFNGYLKHNYLHSIDYFDIYPENLIQQGKDQLTRVSVNYGKSESEQKLPDRIDVGNESIDFPREVFLKLENFKVFNYFIEHFGSTKRPVDLSQIYIWMEKKAMVKPRSGKIFRRLMVSQELVNGSFAKMAPEKHDSQLFLNEVFKKFGEMT